MPKWLDPDAKYLHRLWSVQVTVVGIVFTAIWTFIPAVTYYVSPRAFAAVIVCVGIANLVARALAQPDVPNA